MLAAVRAAVCGSASSGANIFEPCSAATAANGWCTAATSLSSSPCFKRRTVNRTCRSASLQRQVVVRCKASETSNALSTTGLYNGWACQRLSGACQRLGVL